MTKNIVSPLRHFTTKVLNTKSKGASKKKKKNIAILIGKQISKKVISSYNLQLISQKLGKKTLSHYNEQILVAVGQEDKVQKTVFCL